MKSFRNIISAILMMMLVITVLLFEVNITLNTTVLSSDYFSTTIDKNKVGEIISNAIMSNKNQASTNSTKNNINKSNPAIPDQNELIKYLDKNWLSQQVPALLKGTHGYLVGITTSLPIIDIKPFKTSVTNIAIESALKENVRNGNKLNPEFIKTTIVRDMKLDKIKDEFNGNEFLENLSVDGLNPMKALRNLIISIKTISLYSLTSIIIMLIMLISLINIKSPNLIKVNAIPLIIAGSISTIISGVILILLNNGVVNSIISTDGFVSLNFLIKNLLSDFVKNLLISGLFFIIIPLFFIVLPRLVPKSIRQKYGDNLNKIKYAFYNNTVNLTCSLILIISLVLIITQGYNNIYDKLITLQTASKYVQIQKTLFNTIGIQF